MNSKCMIVLFALAFVAIVVSAEKSVDLDQLKKTYEVENQAIFFRLRWTCFEISDETPEGRMQCDECCKIFGKEAKFESTYGIGAAIRCWCKQ